MNIVIGVIWAIAAVVITTATVKYYFPILGKRARKFSETPALPLFKTEISEKSSLLIKMLITAAIATAAGICGFVLSSKHSGLNALLRFSASMMVLLFAALCDLRYELIPNISIIFLTLSRLAALIVEIFCQTPEKAASGFLESLIVASGCFVFLLLMSAITRGGIGGGDIKLFVGLAFLCDFKSVVITFIAALVLCAVFSAIMLIFRKKGLKDTLPMGPFVWLGYLLTTLVI